MEIGNIEVGNISGWDGSEMSTRMQLSNIKCIDSLLFLSSKLVTNNCMPPSFQQHINKFNLTGETLAVAYLDKIIWKNGSFRNRENLQYKKTAYSVLLSLLKLRSL